MTKNTLLVSLIILLASGSSRATDGLECGIAIYQEDEAKPRNVLLYADTVQFVEGLSREGFLMAFSLDILVTAVDSQRSDISVHVITLNRPVSNYARQFRVEHGLPAGINSIAGKNGTKYEIVLTPLRYLDIDTSQCSFDHRDGDQFRFDPSANLNIHYVPQSLADFHWNSIKGLLEETYTQFRDLNQFGLPGKYELFLCPCEIYSVLWDKRFTMMTDPSKTSVFAVYSHDFNSVDPFLLWHVSVLRHHGYAPPFLSEGYANYLSFGVYDMKNIMRTNKAISLSPMLDTYAYLTSDPFLADRVSMSFVRYLINQYKIDRFLDLYRAADDLNLTEQIESNYGKSIGELEQEWKLYVDTVRLTAGQYRKFGERAEASRNFSQALELYKDAYALAATPGDSMRDVAMVARASLITGDFSAAVSNQEQLVALNTAVPITRMTLAGYRMMVGDYEKAADDLKIAMQLDSSNQFIRFNWALNLLQRDQEPAAIREYEQIINNPGDGSAQLEARVMLAGLLRSHDSATDRERAEQLYNDVLAMFNGEVGRTRPQPTQQMWLGIASLGVGDTGTAQERLETASFLESRRFYLGMINLWLGRVADIRGEHDAALEYYSLVLEEPSAEYHRDAARRHLKTPYK